MYVFPYFYISKDRSLELNPIFETGKRHAIELDGGTFVLNAASCGTPNYFLKQWPPTVVGWGADCFAKKRQPKNAERSISSGPVSAYLIISELFRCKCR